ncbi:hypothetical protein CBL_08557 [Carabus blaptoides fortunei]
MPPAGLCPNCNKNIGSDLQKSVKCDGCTKLTHLSCVNLTLDDVTRLTRSHTKSIKIYCNNCLTDTGDSIGSLKKIITALQAQISELYEKLKSPVKPTSDPDLLENVIEELNERRNRENNVIISGIPESSNENVHDIVAKVITKTAPGVSLDNCKIYRVGFRTPTSAHTRLIKIRFFNYDDAFHVIRNAKNARKFPDLKGIYINSDRTPLQQQHFKRVRNELNSRIADGETDLRIVYNSGVPRVSKAKK